MENPARIQAASVSDADLKRRREQIRRRLTGANTAAVVVLLIVIGLSVAAIFQALRAERNAQQAGESARRAEEQLWQSQLAQARAQRLTGVAGRKARSLSAVASAAAIHPSVELRDEAIAALALTDVTEEGAWAPARIYTGEQPAFSPDLDLYALGRAGGEISLFRMATGEKILQVQGPPSFADKIRFSPSGQLLGAHFVNGEFAVWALTNGASLFKVNLGGGNPNSLSFDFSPDHRTLAVANQGVRLFDLASGAEVEHLPLAAASSRVSFRPDGLVLAVGAASDIILWSLRENRVMQSLPHPAAVAWFAWHPNGQRMASACAANGDVWLWDTGTTNHLILKGHSELVHHLSFSHRGEVLMSSAYDGSTRFWNAGSGELLFVSRAGFGRQFSRDDTQVGFVRENQGLGVWKANSSVIYRELNLPLGAGRITGFDFSPNGRAMVMANPEGVHVFDLATGAPLASAPHGNTHAVSFTPEGERVVLVGPDHLHTWSLTVASNQFSLQDKGRLYFQPVLPLDQGSITRGSRHLLALPSLDRVFCLDLSAPTAWWTLPGNGLIGPINSAAISSGTNWIATSYWKNGRTVVWDTRTRQRVRDLGSQGGFVAFSPDDRWLLVGSAQNYRLWELGSWRQVWELSRRSPGELVGRGAFSPDGRTIALCPELNLLQLVEIETGQKLASLPAPLPKNIGWVGFSPDGATLGASTFDNEIQLWNLPETQRQLTALGLGWAADRQRTDVAQTRNGAAPVVSGPTASAARARAPGRFGGSSFYLLAGLGVLVAVLTGVYTLHYHQRMMRSYEQIDSLATQRAGELEVAHAELLHSQKMKALGTLAAGIAHDFNNLLSIIRMGNNLLRRQDISADDKRESSAAVERAVEQGKKVVHSMLGYSRDRPESCQAYSVAELVEEVVLLLSQQFLSGLTLTLELNRDTPSMTGGRGRFEQILLNLIVNASEAMNGKGRLRISTRVVSQPGGEFVLRPHIACRYVELSVEDSGPGIDPKLRNRIFEPFFSTKPQSAASGTGLGLSLVHSLAQQEGMGIRLESEPGRGTVFTILVPAESAERMTNDAMTNDHGMTHVQ